ncbi:MAG: flagellar biosynthesis protein FlhB [Rickettsiales bacterium]|nr:flagellar biosynthesis protein FlhB [Rickettsiales bacterium]
MSEDQDDAQKTEDPTQKKLEDAQKKGQVASSREIMSFFILLAFTFIIIVLLPPTMQDLKLTLEKFILIPEDIDIDGQGFNQTMAELLMAVTADMALLMLLVIVAVFAGKLMQGKIRFATEPIKPKLEKISPLKGVKRMFSMKSIVEFIKGIFKIIIVGGVAVMAVYPEKEYLRLLPDEDIMTIMHFMSMVIARMMIGIIIVIFIIAALDYAYQVFEYMKQLRMTKQEVKDEYKQQEGDPHIKAKLRQLRRERLSKQMMAAVPEADVVVTNPTHFAVALKYDSMNMNAPMVIAKGKDKVALRIKEIAEQNKIITMRNPPLARLLFDNAPMDEEIPGDYYRAVAEIISYVYRLRGIDLSGGPVLTMPKKKKGK